MLKDSQQRLDAVDPTRSFLVQAPAGSGKTELLTQRYLRLLSRVTHPEQIIAITFTRKAASEMRARILTHLKQAANKEQARNSYQQQTRQDAQAALIHSQQQGWELLKYPGRLRIITIDSFCQMLTQAMPLQERNVPFAKITENPEKLYQKAAQICLEQAVTQAIYQEALTCLLIHVDNCQERFLNLLCELLASRDQWLRLMVAAKTQEKSNYEDMLAFIEQHALLTFIRATPADYHGDLMAICQSFAHTVGSEVYNPLTQWNEFSGLTRSIATSLASLLLTSQNTLRKRLDHHVGLKREFCDEKTFHYLKTASKDLFTALETETDFLDALIKIKNLPHPHYEEAQWQVLQAIFQLLPLLLGCLHLSFQEEEAVDFAAVSEQALLALGNAEEPTELALLLDYSIQHLLIDEFQDTSLQQFELLTQLVQGWEPQDGRTLFLVGDPMQSIYRFRQAEVGLFLRAKRHGLGAVVLNFLELTCNFRSTPCLVDWTNQQLKTIFPSHDDMELGAVSFHPAQAVINENHDSHIHAWQLSDEEQEADAVVTIARNELNNYPNARIAILVRSRAKLSGIISRLKQQQIAFEGVDINLLAELSHLKDLWTLTQAHLRPANRLIWLALLRSPLGGLSLSDLHVIANYERRNSIYYALSQLDLMNNLSKEGYYRARFVYFVMHEAITTRYRQSLTPWIAATFKALHGETILSPSEQADIISFWRLLTQYTDKEQSLDIKRFHKAFNRLYSQQAHPSRLQIMTIHKSKGLEFDCVILPHLSAKTRGRESPFLRWLRLPSEAYEDLLLISPMKSANQSKSLLYDYLGQLDNEKENYELQRLLYVAVTRAKKRLYLLDHGEKSTKNTLRALLKNQPFITKIEENCSKKSGYTASLFKLPLDFYPQTHPPSLSITETAMTLSEHTEAKQIGVIAHELLQWICTFHPQHQDELPWLYIKNRLKSLGLCQQDQHIAIHRLKLQINNLFSDPIGQWIMTAHDEEQNEYELLVANDEIIQQRIIDRLFVEDNIQWIIDFKTGRDDLNAQQKHFQQVNHYAQLITSLSSLSIRCGLYYLATGNWVTWDYSLPPAEKKLLSINSY